MTIYAGPSIYGSRGKPPDNRFEEKERSDSDVSSRSSSPFKHLDSLTFSSDTSSAGASSVPGSPVRAFIRPNLPERDREARGYIKLYTDKLDQLLADADKHLTTMQTAYDKAITKPRRFQKNVVRVQQPIDAARSRIDRKKELLEKIKGRHASDPSAEAQEHFKSEMMYGTPEQIKQIQYALLSAESFLKKAQSKSGGIRHFRQMSPRKIIALRNIQRIALGNATTETEAICERIRPLLHTVRTNAKAVREELRESGPDVYSADLDDLARYLDEQANSIERAVNHHSAIARQLGQNDASAVKKNPLAMRQIDADINCRRAQAQLAHAEKLNVIIWDLRAERNAHQVNLNNPDRSRSAPRVEVGRDHVHYAENAIALSIQLIKQQQLQLAKIHNALPEMLTPSDQPVPAVAARSNAVSLAAYVKSRNSQRMLATAHDERAEHLRGLDEVELRLAHHLKEAESEDIALDVKPMWYYDLQNLQWQSRMANIQRTMQQHAHSVVAAQKIITLLDPPADAAHYTTSELAAARAVDLATAQQAHQQMAPTSQAVHQLLGEMNTLADRANDKWIGQKMKAYANDLANQESSAVLEADTYLAEIKLKIKLGNALPARLDRSKQHRLTIDIEALSRQLLSSQIHLQQVARNAEAMLAFAKGEASRSSDPVSREGATLQNMAAMRSIPPVIENSFVSSANSGGVDDPNRVLHRAL